MPDPFDEIRSAEDFQREVELRSVSVTEARFRKAEESLFGSYSGEVPVPEVEDMSPLSVELIAQYLASRRQLLGALDVYSSNSGDSDIFMKYGGFIVSCTQDEIGWLDLCISEFPHFNSHDGYPTPNLDRYMSYLNQQADARANEVMERMYNKGLNAVTPAQRIFLTHAAKYGLCLKQRNKDVLAYYEYCQNPMFPPFVQSRIREIRT